MAAKLKPAAKALLIIIDNFAKDRSMLLTKDSYVFFAKITPTKLCCTDDKDENVLNEN
jgi:hypothetical protein